MSKYVKRLEMDFLAKELQSVRDLVVVNVVGMEVNATCRLRQELRKKGIRLRVVKNALARKVFDGMGLRGVAPLLDGSCCLAWGGEGIVDLAREMSGWAGKIERLVVRGALVEGQAVSQSGVKMLSQLPSREELLGRVSMLAQAPAARVAMLATAPASRVLSQVRQKAEPAESGDSAASEAGAESGDGQ